ncbi:M28 family peptidase, partial [bacterium]|nr:M28 family peptidase [bacterium]
MRKRLLACLALLCLTASLASAAGTGRQLVRIAGAGETGPALVDREVFLVAELPAADGYLAFVDAAELAQLRAWGRAVEVLDPSDDGSREYLIAYRHAPGAAHTAHPDPAGARVLLDAAQYRLLSVPAGDLALTPSCLPDIQRVFRRPLRFARSPWTEAAPLRDVDPVITAMVAGVVQSELQSQVQTLQNFGTRHSQYAGGLNASLWIRDQFLSYGYTDVTFHNYNSWNDNVVCVKPGAVYPDRYVVIGGHYDSTNFSGDSYAPGADDNATGTVGVLQAAKAMAGREFEYTAIFK